MQNYKEKAKELVSQMTLEEKVSQMLHSSPAIKRLGITAYNWWNEALHGVARSGTATVFPQAIALAAAFNPEIVQKVADAISDEARAKFNAYKKYGDRDMYKGITFWSPNINIFRDPRWGRGQETYGEDPYLTSLTAAAFIRGLQGSDGQSLKTAACAKHFAVHSGPENDRHNFNAVIDKYDLWNTYLAAFEYSVKEAGVVGIMGAYNRLYGEPCCASKYLLEEILCDKWGFDGYVVSDYNAIKNIHENHKTTSCAKESVAAAVNNGCDLEAGHLFGLALEDVREGLIKEERIDEAVERLLVIRMHLGILTDDESSKYDLLPYSAVDSPENRDLNLEAARRSIVMLKNDGILPLKSENIKTIGIIGPNADSRRALEGNYNGTASEYITVLEGVRGIAAESGMRVLFAEGSHMYRSAKEDLALDDDRLAEACSVAENSDSVIVCLGLDADFEGEEDETPERRLMRGDKKDLDLPETQIKLLKAVIKAANGKPVIAVIISGSALNLSYLQKNVSGIFQVFYPGALGGKAVAEALFGRFSPSAKLPVTFYKNIDDIPDFGDYSMKGRTYRYFKGDALYPFGFGLGYCKFGMNDFKVSRESCHVKVKNTGRMDAHETLQVYVSSTGQREIRNLCGMQSIFLKSGEENEFKILLNKNAFSRYNENGIISEIKGKHTLSIGFTQPDRISIELYGQSPLNADIIID